MLVSPLIIKFLKKSIKQLIRIVIFNKKDKPASLAKTSAGLSDCFCCPYTLSGAGRLRMQRFILTGYSLSLALGDAEGEDDGEDSGDSDGSSGKVT